MHYVMYALTDKENAKNSQEAREYVKSVLENDNSFVGEGGIFGGPVADWFVIGGRWSGVLSDKTWAKEVNKKIKELEEKEGVEVRGVSYGDAEKTKKQQQIKEIAETLYREAIPAEYKGCGLVFDRDSYQDTGYADDGMLVTDKIFEKVIVPFLENTKEYCAKYGKVSRVNTYNLSEPILVDLEENVLFSNFDEVQKIDMTEVKKQIVGKKWMVVVDYHN